MITLSKKIQLYLIIFVIIMICYSYYWELTQLLGLYNLVRLFKILLIHALYFIEIIEIMYIGILSVKQLNSHFNWINGCGFIIFLVLSLLCFFFFRMDINAMIAIFTVKTLFQIICMTFVLKSKS